MEWKERIWKGLKPHMLKLQLLVHPNNTIHRKPNPPRMLTHRLLGIHDALLRRGVQDLLSHILKDFIAGRNIDTAVLEVTVEMVLVACRAPIFHTEELEFVLVVVDFSLLGDGKVVVVTFELEELFLSVQGEVGEKVDVV
jgi:hypothetical protein